MIDYVKIARDGQGMASRELQPLIVAHLYDLMAVAIGATRMSPSWRAAVACAPAA